MKLPVAALVAVVALACAEAVYLRMTPGFTGIPVFEPTVDDAVVAARLKAIAGPVAVSDTVIVGDSSALRGVVPEVLGNGGTRRFYNLGTFSSFGLAGQLELAAAAIDEHDSIRSVVVSVLPLSLSLQEHQVREFGLLGRYLVSHPSRLGVFPVAMDDRLRWFRKKHRINRLPAHMGGSFDGLYEALTLTDGYLAKRSAPIDTERRFGPVRASGFALRSLSAFMVLTRARNVEVILTFNPRPQSVVTPDYQASSRELLSSISKRFPDIVFDQDVAPVWEERYFSDASHLNQDGAERNSLELRGRRFSQPP